MWTDCMWIYLCVCKRFGSDSASSTAPGAFRIRREAKSIGRRASLPPRDPMRAVYDRTLHKHTTHSHSRNWCNELIISETCSSPQRLSLRRRRQDTAHCRSNDVLPHPLSSCLWFQQTYWKICWTVMLPFIVFIGASWFILDFRMKIALYSTYRTSKFIEYIVNDRKQLRAG